MWLKVLLCATVLPCVWSNYEYILVNKYSNCDYEGYPLATGVTRKKGIKKIEAPLAKMEGNVLTAIAGKGGAVARALGSAAPLMAQFAKASKILKCFGTLGAVFGALDAFTKPTPQDILNAANKAIAKLTEEVNKRFEEITAYVDESIVQLEKELIERDYKHIYALWRKCVTEPEFSEEQVRCQRDAWRFVTAAQGKFMLFVDKRNTWASNPPPINDIKRMEVNMISFRDYAQLVLMIGKTLTDTYEDQTSLVNTEHYLDLYGTDLSVKAKLFTVYAGKVKNLL